jgi:hypothetical protein
VAHVRARPHHRMDIDARHREGDDGTACTGKERSSRDER